MSPFRDVHPSVIVQGEHRDGAGGAEDVLAPAEDPLSRITPVRRAPGDHAANAVHAHLRRLILRGGLAPGAVLNQVELAPRLGVSRTPVREAIRMLQEEGLVEAEPQKRARVAGFDPAHLEAVYAQRILLECLGARLTADGISDAEVDGIEALRLEMVRHAGQNDMPAWEQAHRAFHLALVQRAGSHLLAAIRGQMERAERYRMMYQKTGPRAWSNAGVEHRAILAALRRGDADAAAAELATHLARTALSLVAQLSPDYDPRAVRTALGTMRGSDSAMSGIRRSGRHGDRGGCPPPLS